MRPRYRSHMRDNIRYHLTLLMESHTGSLPGASRYHYTEMIIIINCFFISLKHSFPADASRTHQRVKQAAQFR